MDVSQEYVLYFYFALLYIGLFGKTYLHDRRELGFGRERMFLRHPLIILLTASLVAGSL